MKYSVIFRALDESWVAEHRRGRIYSPIVVEVDAPNGVILSGDLDPVTPGDVYAARANRVDDGACPVASERSGVARRQVAAALIRQDAEIRKAELRSLPDAEDRFLTVDEAVELMGLEIEDDLNDGYDLVYIDRGDKLMDGQVDSVLSGDLDEVEESFGEWLDDNRHIGALHHATDLVELVTTHMVREGLVDDDDADDVEIEAKNSDWWEGFLHDIEERDQSDPLKDLAERTPDPYVLVDLGGVEALGRVDLADLIETRRSNWDADEVVVEFEGLHNGAAVKWGAISRTHDYANDVRLEFSPVS